MKKNNKKRTSNNMLQKINDYTKTVSSNKLFVGAMMIFMNIGSSILKLN